MEREVASLWRNGGTGVMAIELVQSSKVKVKVLVFQSCLTLCYPMDCNLPSSSVHGILRQEYWSGLPVPSPGDLSDAGIESRSPALQADSLPFEPLKPKLQYFGHLMGRADWVEKDPDAGKDWGQEKKWATEEEMFWWHHWLNGHEFEQTPGDSEGQRNPVCCSSWGCKESDMT